MLKSGGHGVGSERASPRFFYWYGLLVASYNHLALIRALLVMSSSDLNITNDLLLDSRWRGD